MFCRRPEPPVQIFLEGMAFEDVLICWSEVTRVTAWMRDLLSVDQLWITVESAEATLSVSENEPGWKDLLIAIEREWGVEFARLHELWGNPFSKETLVLVSRS